MTDLTDERVKELRELARKASVALDYADARPADWEANEDCSDAIEYLHDACGAASILALCDEVLRGRGGK